MLTVGRIIERNVSTALVLEDDADWDVTFKHQLTLLARGVRYVLAENSPDLAAPYGTSWDMLWIGNYSPSLSRASCADPKRQDTVVRPTRGDPATT